MKRKWTALLLTVCLIFTICSSGCSGAIELNDRVLVKGIGIDVKDELYEVTFHIFNAEASGESEPDNIDVVSTTGRSVFEAFDNLSLRTGKDGLFSQNLILIIGEEAAKTGVSQLIDPFIRYPESRPTVQVLVAHGCTARELMSCRYNDELVKADVLADIATSGETNSKVQPVDLLTFAGDLKSRFAQPFAASAHIETDGENQQVVADGTAVFREDKLVGYLNSDETKGFLLLSGDIEGGAEAVEVPGVGMVTYAIQHTQSEVRASVREDTPCFDVSVSVDANIYEIDYITDENLPNRDYDVLEKALEERFQELIDRTLHILADTLHTDILDFGRRLLNSDPGYFKTVESNWAEVFATADIRTDISVSVKRIGQEINPL